MRKVKCEGVEYWWQYPVYQLIISKACQERCIARLGGLLVKLVELRSAAAIAGTTLKREAGSDNIKAAVL